MRKHVSSILTFVVLCCVCTDSAFAAHGSVWPLQKRIDEIAAKGGGTLVLTAGVYRTGAIFFKPGVDLHLENGAANAPRQNRVASVFFPRPRFRFGLTRALHESPTSGGYVASHAAETPPPRPREALLTGSAAILAAFWTLYLHRGSFAAIQILPKISGGY